MNLAMWFPWYKEILEAFSFSQEDDAESAKLLNELLEGSNGLSPSDIPVKNQALVFGAGPSLKKNIIELKSINSSKSVELSKSINLSKSIDLSNFTLIAADGATTALLEEDVVPDIIVTDLDGRMEDIIRANQKGSFLAVHAHGNNLEKIKKWVPTLKHILGTTQSIPLKNVYNFGGFTDGDRALFLAVELGAKCIVLAGMDFGKVVTRYSRPDMSKSEDKADEIKELKLKYGKQLVEWAAENEDVSIFNISHGETLDGVQDINIMDLKDLRCRS